VQYLEKVLLTLSSEPDSQAGENFALGLLSVRLGRFREKLAQHLSHYLNIDRSPRSLLVFAALCHDIGKPPTYEKQESGRIRFYEHEQIGALKATTRATCLHLSNLEIVRLNTIVRHHLRPILLAGNEQPPTRRAIYRFFQDTREAGVDVCFLALADTLATYGVTLPQEHWVRLLDVVRTLLESWWEKPRENLFPLRLLSGNDLIQTFKLTPGPIIGQLLTAIEEAQASGKIASQEQALIFAREWLANREEISPN
jgi:hypothetical protein